MEQKEIRYPSVVNDKGSLTQIEKQILGSMIAISGAGTILELGVFKGVTTKFICNFLLENSIPAKVYGFDVPDVAAKLSADPELRRFIDFGILELVPGYLPHSLQGWLDNHSEQIDFVLDDAMHDYPSVFSELKLVWPRLSAQGVVVCHDYSPMFNGVVYGVNKFARRHGIRPFPLISSSKAASQGYASVLVGLRKKQYPLQMSQQLSQEVLRLKMAFAKTALWKGFLRPLLKRS